MDVTAGHLLLNFMDAFSGYHQIRIIEEDIPKTAFITHRVVYAFKSMSFGLVNAGATYQRIEHCVQGVDRKKSRGLCRRHDCEKPNPE